MGTRCSRRRYCFWISRVPWLKHGICFRLSRTVRHSCSLEKGPTLTAGCWADDELRLELSQMCHSMRSEAFSIIRICNLRDCFWEKQCQARSTLCFAGSGDSEARYRGVTNGEGTGPVSEFETDSKPPGCLLSRAPRAAKLCRQGDRGRIFHA